MAAKRAWLLKHAAALASSKGACVCAPWRLCRGAPRRVCFCLQRCAGYLNGMIVLTVLTRRNNGTDNKC